MRCLDFLTPLQLSITSLFPLDEASSACSSYELQGPSEDEAVQSVTVKNTYYTKPQWVTESRKLIQ